MIKDTIKFAKEQIDKYDKELEILEERVTDLKLLKKIMVASCLGMNSCEKDFIDQINDAPNLEEGYWKKDGSLNVDEFLEAYRNWQTESFDLIREFKENTR